MSLFLSGTPHSLMESLEYGYKPGSFWTSAPVFMKRGENYFFYVNDHHGTPQEMVNMSGQTVWRADYQTFGRAAVGLEAQINNLRFAGQYYDSETGLCSNWHRYYDPETGRYISSDPLKDGKNWYVYCGSNPLVYSDPMGLSAFGSFMSGVGDGIAEGICFVVENPVESIVGAIVVGGVAEGLAMIPVVGPYIAGAFLVGLAVYSAWPDIERMASSCYTADERLKAAGRVAPKVFFGLLLGKVGRVPGAVKNSKFAQKLGGIFGGRAAKGGMTNAELVQSIATRADAWGARQGLGSGARAGTLKHSYADDLLTRYQRRFGDRGLSTEVSYLNGQAGLGGRGSIRLDVVEGAIDNPTAIFDYKFGGASLTPARILQIRKVGQFGPHVPVIGVHP